MTGPDPTPFPLDHLALRGDADTVALVVGEQAWTYAQLDRDVGRMAASMRAMGLASGDRVATWMGKTATACMMPMAAARAGLVHVPINPFLKAAQARHILDDSAAALLIANRARLDTLDHPVRTVANEAWELVDTQLEPSSADPEDLVALLYTSGSTGQPKGVMLSHANLWLGAASVAHYLGVGRHDRTLCVLPLAFDYGQNQLLSTWHGGGTAIAFDYMLPKDVKGAIRRHDVTILAGVPPLWHQLATLDWSDGSGTGLRTLTNSGGHLAEPLVRKLRTTFPDARLHLMYGLTEAFRSASLDPALVDAHPDSVGTAIPFAELMIVGERGDILPDGEEGELVHAGPLVAKGYWKDAGKTAERFRHAPEGSRYGGTAVYSGDRMVRGKDGLLRFRARDNAMIKVSGNRLSPTEVEELAMSSGLVSEVAAFGIPDDALGEAVALVAVAKSDAQDTEKTLLSLFRREAPAYMLPKRILWLDALPTGATGKADRIMMKEMLR